MKKMLILMLCIGLIPVLHATSDRAPQTLPDLKAPHRTNFVMPELPATDQDTLWAQYPNPVTAIGMACQLDSAYPFEAWLLDDVTPPTADADYVVEEVVSWWANWNGFTTWTLVPNIHFQVYEDSGLAYPFPKIMPWVDLVVEQVNYTATTIGTDQYLLEMTLPSTVILPAGEISWVCVQPSNVFTVNGQTGWMGEPGIGNGQECYFAFPLLGNEKWVTATSVFGTPNEAGFALLGTEGGGAVSILFIDDDNGNPLETYWETSFANNGYAYDKWTVADSGNVTPNASQMGAYDIVVWTTGEDWSYTLYPTDTVEIGNYLAAGGAMWLSSQDVLYDIGAVGWMHLSSFTSDVGCTQATGVGPIMTGASYATTGGAMSDYSDNITGDAMTWAEMENQSSLDNTIAMDSSSGTAYKLFFNTFGYENITSVPDRDDMMYRVIEWLKPVTGVHDVASFAFLSPGTVIGPGDVDVIGVTRNYGGFEETYDVHCVVTDPTFATVLDTTINVTTAVGENDTINFGTLTFIDGYTYDLVMATLLAGDDNPVNDTLSQATYVTLSGWEIWPDLPEGRSGPYAGFWNIDGQSYVYCFGGNPGPMATAIKYDGSWTGIPSMPVASTYGGHASVDGKIYLIGAWTGQNGLLTIFDCESETYSSMNLPIPIADPAIAVYQDNYIYSIGGSNPPGWAGSTIVQLYDIAGDSFFTAVTQLPSAGYVTTAAAGYIGNDTIIVAGGYDVGATNKVTTGAIDPGNPANVAWSAATPFPGAPVYRCYGGAVCNDAGDYMFILAGGSPYTSQTHGYRSNIGWFMLEPKPTACSNCGAVAGPWESLVDDAPIFLYTLGGYTGSYLNAFEVYRTGWYTGIQERPDNSVTVFGFSAKTANPVKDQVRFTLSMPYQGEVRFQVFDVTGRKVIDVGYSSISRGEHTLFWNLKDEQYRNVAAGTYFYRFQADEHTATGKLVVVR